ncbi:MAG: DUF5011 domain-containing protein [Sulfurovum sp.]|uniref:immunoglobulin-like domain-containing protein n=1 Tax=Sulfurovum sp. TaxID=1969726 RepID=UPI002867FD51|nr:immunoglobulin-like domain-containing protein [Sulfurovum sp.]MCO4844382.1 DUF5011 domain-containing protein [Sulfurovum sp.]
MKPLFSLTFSIIFLLFLNACGGGSSSTGSIDDNTTVDATPPVITVLGNNPTTVVQNYIYTDAGATALDDIDGPLDTITTGSVDTSTVGIYSIIYTATDSAGNTAEATRTVNVITVPDAKVHDSNFTTTHFSGSKNCAFCHDGISDSTSKDVSIAKVWHSTMMANAATDPLWKAKVATEVNEHPEFKADIEAKCSRCHTPMATVEATFDDPTGSTVVLTGADGFFDPGHEYYHAAMQGVSCTLCHQIENNETLGTTDGFSGNFEIADNTDIARKIYGPYEDNLKIEPMQNKVQFTPEYSPHMNESKLCASCHNLNTPVIDTNGTVTTDTFPEQAAYTEWEYSDFNATQSCQDCHMPKSSGSVVISTRGQNLEQRSPFYQHKFLGANTYMLEIIKQNRDKLGPIADDASFDKTIADTRDFLMAAADVNITETNIENGQLKFTVLLTNHSGHKFPTGFPSRRVWLHTTVTNEAKQIVFDSGAFSDEGKIIGVDDNTTLNGYQPHYEKINNESQVQVYETILSDTDDNMTYILLHALHYIKDNRILPRGMDKTNVPENINPHGKAEDDSNFIGGSDTIEYEIGSLPQGNYTIAVTLHYQTLSYGFAQDMYKHDELPEVALMKALDSNATKHYETISTDIASVIIP